jgi:molybdopterin molybdotransferase
VSNTIDTIHWHQALEIILNSAPIKEVETLDMTSAVGRALALPIISPSDYPPFDCASVDGYAVKSADTISAPVSLRNIGIITAGIVSSLNLQAGQCIKIMTGAQLPQGADAVIPLEDVAGNEVEIQIKTPIPAGKYYIKQGTVFKKGQEVISKGTTITATEVGVMAGFGLQRISIYKVPTVAVIATGDELVEPWVLPPSGLIRNTNAYVLLTLLRQMGISVHYLGICPDNQAAISQKVLSGLQDDVLIIIGGTAKGDKDFTRQAMESQGMQVVFDRLALKPGSSTIFAIKGSRLALGLPGPPVAMRAMCHLLVIPLLKKMMGCQNPIPVMYTGTFQGTFVKPIGIEFFLTCRTEFRENGFVVQPSITPGTASHNDWKTANALIHIPAEVEQLRDGELVKFLNTTIC